MGFIDHACNFGNQVSALPHELIVNLYQGRNFRDIAFRKEVLTWTFNPERYVCTRRDECIVAPPSTVFQYIDRTDEVPKAGTEVDFTRTLQAFARRSKSITTLQPVLNNGFKKREHPDGDDCSVQLNHLQVLHVSCSAAALQSLNYFLFRYLEGRECEVS